MMDSEEKKLASLDFGDNPGQYKYCEGDDHWDLAGSFGAIRKVGFSKEYLLSQLLQMEDRENYFHTLRLKNICNIRKRVEEGFSQ